MPIDPHLEEQPLLKPLRTSLLEKLNRSLKAWDTSVFRFRMLHWFCLAGIIVVPTCLASLKDYILPFPFALLSVFVAICGSVQSIVKPADKFMRDIEFRDEADYLIRQAEATSDPDAIEKLTQEFERVERQFHQGQHPWPVPKRNNAGLRGKEE